MANNYRHTNAVPVAALSRWVIVALFLAVAGLSYVYFKNQLHATGAEIRNLERTLAELEMQNDIVRGKISQLSCHSYLQKLYHEGRIHMVPISDDHIARLPNLPAKLATNDMRPAANKGSVK